jgi:hypothetical protein
LCWLCRVVWLAGLAGLDGLAGLGWAGLAVLGLLACCAGRCGWLLGWAGVPPAVVEFHGWPGWLGSNRAARLVLESFAGPGSSSSPQMQILLLKLQ